jgi:arylsulfatase A-like enzyme
VTLISLVSKLSKTAQLIVGSHLFCSLQDPFGVALCHDLALEDFAYRNSFALMIVSMSPFKRCLFLGVILASFLKPALSADERPNILWITSEDNGPFLGCYGDPIAKTPHLDALAAKGIRYTNAFANAPVCAPARSSWIFGAPAASLGTLHMRSKYRVPRDLFKTYAELLKESGYYVTNNVKTDYNTRSIDEAAIWDESSTEAHHKNGPEDKPFFAVMNSTRTHESRVFPERRPEETRFADASIELPPYHYPSPEAINDWRMYYEWIARYDEEVGKHLAELEASGKADNTIVVYNSDHGGVTLRSKRFLHDSGTRVPLIVYFPKKWQHLAPAQPGSVSDRLVQFIDMPKTFLSLVGVEIPETMPGHIFLGEHLDSEPDSLFLFSGRFDEAPDNSRAVTDGRWKYIRNFEPDRPRFQMLSFPLQQEGQQAQLEAYRAGLTNPLQSAQYEMQPPEELYDTLNDPHEVNNLVATEPKKLKEMRTLLRRHILESHDLGFLPEPLMEQIDLSEETTIYEYGQDPGNYPLERVLDSARLASMQDPGNVHALKKNLADPNESVRYWAALGLRVLGAQAADAEAELEAALLDVSPSVRITAAVALGRIGQRERMAAFLLKEALAAQADKHALWALDGLKLLEIENPFAGMLPAEMDQYNKGRYSSRLVRRFKALAAQ